MKIVTLNFPDITLSRLQYEQVHEIVQRALGDEYKLVVLPIDGVLTMPRDEAILASLLRIEELLSIGAGYGAQVIRENEVAAAQRRADLAALALTEEDFKPSGAA